MRFERNDAGIKDVLGGAGVRQHIDTVTRQIADAARRLAPSGFMEYRDTIEAIPAKDTPEGPVGYVGSSSPVWHLPEYGTARVAPSAPIRNAVAQVGIKFEEG